ncbi:MAG: GNAT family N-acetyltransferase [Rhodospirillales bacterium]|nr:GNAT family N-acetyltransferase [Rhodospirillales bacterium]
MCASPTRPTRRAWSRAAGGSASSSRGCPDVAAGALIRPGRDADAPGYIALVREAWLSYPGCVFDLDEDAPDLRAWASHVAGEGGAVWTAEQEGAVVGMVGTHPLAGGTWELVRMYVAPAARGGGLAARLVAQVEAHARAAGAAELVLWSDTRFARAHAFYEKQDYLRSGPIRVVNDRANTLEFRYRKPVAGVEIRMLDPMEAESAVARLAALLAACVDAGASLGYAAPMDPAQARAFWRERAAHVARGGRRIGVAWLDGRIVGSVMLDLEVPAIEQHRAAVKKLLVAPSARRRGIGAALLAAAEAEAARLGCSLLTLDARTGGEAERLYLARGWTLAGSVPGYAVGPHGERHGASLLYKAIEVGSALR